MESQENRDQAQEVNESAAIEGTKEVSAAQFLADAHDYLDSNSNTHCNGSIQNLHSKSDSNWNANAWC